MNTSLKGKKLKNNAVIIVHGLFMNSSIMYVMAKRFKQARYDVFHFSYPTTKSTIEEDVSNLLNLYKKIINLGYKKIHFIGHSLGGLIIYQLNTSFKEEITQEGRIVTLGTPYKSSSIAKKVSNLGLKRLLGKSLDKGLIEPIGEKWNNNLDLGVIAGTLNFGFRTILIRDKKISDGAVSLDETKIPESKDYITLPCTHMQLIFSKSSFNQALFFLENGYFIKNNN